MQPGMVLRPLQLVVAWSFVSSAPRLPRLMRGGLHSGVSHLSLWKRMSEAYHERCPRLSLRRYDLLKRLSLRMRCGGNILVPRCSARLCISQYLAEVPCALEAPSRTLRRLRKGPRMRQPALL